MAEKAGQSKAFITGLAGLALSAEEEEFIRRHRPWGFVLFARNIESMAQLQALNAALRAAAGRENLPIFVDQEGGRVQRLRPPLAPLYPPAAQIGALYEADKKRGLRAAWLAGRLIACDLRRAGFSGDFLPLLDVPVAGSHDVIGDRAYARAAAAVAELGEQAAQGLCAGGLLAVMKHIPGHGRAMADTHKDPARVAAGKTALRRSDFAPFKTLSALPAAMTAHVVYEAYDAENPATLSAEVIEQVIRAEIGFDGLLMSDDLSMQALPGSMAERAKGCFAAGCDVALHCNGDMAEMLAVAEASPVLSGKALARARAAEAWIKQPEAGNEAALRAEFDALMQKPA